MHGPKYVNYALTETDLLIAVGVRFDDRVTGKLSAFATKAKVIHIDIDPAEIGKNKPVDVPIVGDAKTVLTTLVAELRKAGAEPHSEAWMRQIDDWRKRFPLHYDHDTTRLMPQLVVERVRELTKDRPTVICTEVGQNQMWACQFSRLREPRTWVSSGGLGTMGFGLPGAIGAQVGRPGHLVIDIAGDGSIQMNRQEMATAAIEKLPVKVVILNNGFLGMVRQWQELFYDHRYASSVLDQNCPDFVKLADAYGWHGSRVTSPDELDAALIAAFDHPGPALVDCRVVGEENVFPMVAPGGSIDEMLGGLPGGPVSDMMDDGAGDGGVGMNMQHTLSVLVENKPGVLTRVTSLFARRGFNIDSLAVGVTEDPSLSRITIVVGGEDTSLEQVAKQLHKLINVIKIQDLDPKEMVDRELVLFTRSTRRLTAGTRSSRSPTCSAPRSSTWAATR